jgi:methylated-DNA-[protein]-cysteine S-methyltransferase
MRDNAAGGHYTCARIETAFGWVGVVGSDRGLVELVFPQPDRESVMERLSLALSAKITVDDDAFPELADELRRYFAGEKVRFSGAIDERVGTPFQQDVWRAVAAIPHGQVVSYGEVARRVGKPGAARAVGNTMAANPTPIVVPCHRVVTAQGTIGGFGGGLALKRRLLALEGVDLR